MSNALFRKWHRWLTRIYEDQLQDLLINQHIFQQFLNCTKPYKGTHEAADLAQWMNQGYVTFAATAIRRMVEEPQTLPSSKKKQCPKCKHVFPARTGRARPGCSISMVVLLRDLQKNSNLLTIQRFRWMYRNSVALPFADGHFRKITRNKRATSLSSSRIGRDIRALKKAAAPIKRLVNKIIAHTEEDRRLRGKVTYQQLNAAIALLADLFKMYSLLINGSCCDPLVPLDDYDASGDLERVWRPISK